METLLAQVQEFLAVLALSVADDGGQHIPAGTLRHRHDAVDHVLHLLRFNRQAGSGGIGRPGPGEQQAQVVRDFGDRPDSGPGILGRCLLLDGNRRAQPADVIHIRLFHHIKELPRISA